MTPQELKNGILQLAIQGKLVEQRAEEGTGRELLEKILAAKNAKDAEEGKGKGRLTRSRGERGDAPTSAPSASPSDEISDDEKPFDIPDSREWVRHNALFEIVGGSQPPKSKFRDKPQEGYVRLYQIRDYGEKPVPVYVPTKMVSKFTQKGDILLARYGASLGKIFWAEKGAYNVAMAKVVRLYEGGMVDNKYLYYYYRAPLYQTFIKGNTRSAQAGFNKEDLNNLVFPLPPLAEQKRIVAKIEELLPLIDRYENAWSRLESFNKSFPVDMQKSILQMAIQGKLVEQRAEEGTGRELLEKILAAKNAEGAKGRGNKLTRSRGARGGGEEAGISNLPKAAKSQRSNTLSALSASPRDEIPDDEKPFDIPDSWEWVRVGDVCTNIQYGSSKKSASTGIVPVLRMGNIQNGKIDYRKLVYTSDEDEIRKYTLEVDDLLFNRTNSKELVGKVAIYKGEQSAIYAGYLVRLTPMNISADYLNYVMQSQYYWEYCQSVRSDAIGQSNINAEKLKCFVFPLPPLAEQKRIVAKLEELLPLCERLK